ncbi:MAG: hypothetical protein CM15mP120_08680 [Pseudomonadota bacterium]|nr:MAG: hypothetical protein CM15mP120_08680 [Pseudomonadota bacterium]
MGEPDVIIDNLQRMFRKRRVDYKYKMVTNPLDEDVWVKAAEIIPGDRSVLHHVITTFGELETEGRRAGKLKRGTGGGLGGYVPGAIGKPFPEDTGFCCRGRNHRISDALHTSGCGNHRRFTSGTVSVQNSHPSTSWTA